MLLAKQADTQISLAMAKDLLAAGCNASRVNRSETPRDALYYAIDAPKDEHRRPTASAPYSKRIGIGANLSVGPDSSYLR